jgi:hypothetical protein
MALLLVSLFFFFFFFFALLSDFFMHPLLLASLFCPLFFILGGHVLKACVSAQWWSFYTSKVVKPVQAFASQK